MIRLLLWTTLFVLNCNIFVSSYCIHTVRSDLPSSFMLNILFWTRSVAYLFLDSAILVYVAMKPKFSMFSMYKCGLLQAIIVLIIIMPSVCHNVKASNPCWTSHILHMVNPWLYHVNRKTKINMRKVHIMTECYKCGMLKLHTAYIRDSYI